MSWTPEKTVMVEAMSASQAVARTVHKVVWNRLTVGEQADEILNELRRRGWGVAEASTISLGNTARRKAISGS